MTCRAIRIVLPHRQGMGCGKDIKRTDDVQILSTPSFTRKALPLCKKSPLLGGWGHGYVQMEQVKGHDDRPFTDPRSWCVEVGSNGLLCIQLGANMRIWVTRKEVGTRIGDICVRMHRVRQTTKSAPSYVCMQGPSSPLYTWHVCFFLWRTEKESMTRIAEVTCRLVYSLALQ